MKQENFQKVLKKYYDDQVEKQIQSDYIKQEKDKIQKLKRSTSYRPIKEYKENRENIKQNLIEVNNHVMPSPSGNKKSK